MELIPHALLANELVPFLDRPIPDLLTLTRAIPSLLPVLDCCREAVLREISRRHCVGVVTDRLHLPIATVVQFMVDIGMPRMPGAPYACYVHYEGGGVLMPGFAIKLWSRWQQEYSYHYCSYEKAKEPGGVVALARRLLLDNAR